MNRKKTLWTCLLMAFSTLGLPVAQAQQPGIELVNFKEMPDPTAQANSDWSSVEEGLNSSFVSIDTRYPKSLVPAVQPRKQEALRGWKGETVSAQVLLWTTQERKNVEVQVSAFSDALGNQIAAENAQARFVRYVLTDEFASGCGYRKPEDFAVSLSPDMLDNLSSFTLEENKARPVWITVRIPSAAVAGNYEAKVDLKEDGKLTESLLLNLEVLDAQLPAPSEWTFHLDLWQHPSAVARVNGLTMWSDAHFEKMKPVMKMLADLGQKVITTTLNKDPWNVQTYDPYADMITWEKQSDGNWKYDYSVFDRWVQFMMDLGVNKMINCYSIIPWNNEIHYFDAKNQKMVNVVAKPGTAVFEELWTPFLKDFSKHLASKGWLEITNIAIDERTREEVDGALKVIQQVAPELGVSYADNQKTYQRYPNSQDISVAIADPFSVEDLKDRQRRGLNTSFYVCCSDGFPNTFTFSDPAEATYLPWYTAASGFDGMLRWSYNSWVENPLLDSRFRAWPAGDTYLVYPNARSSIRYERLLEGLQDYAKIQIIKEKLKEKGDAANLNKLDQAIHALNQIVRTETWNQDLNLAKELLNDLSVL